MELALLLMKLLPKRFQERSIPFDKAMLLLMFLSVAVFSLGVLGLAKKATRREDFYSKRGSVQSCLLKRQSDVDEYHVARYKILEVRLERDQNVYRSWFRLDESDTMPIASGKSVSLLLKHEEPIHNHLNFYEIVFDGRKLGSIEEVLKGERVTKTISLIMLMISGVVFYQCRKSRNNHLEKMTPRGLKRLLDG
jgi:hypothetical protein